MRFKEFLLNETSAYLAQKVGDVLTALQELQEDAANMGARDLTQYSQQIVNQIRRILHSSWPKEEKPHLVQLQKIAVAIMIAIDKKSDLPGTITAATSAMEKVVADLGVPINKLAGTETPKSGTDDGKGTGDAEKAQKQQAPKEQTPPPQPETLDSAPNGTPPAGGTGQDMAAPPLGGNSGPMDAF
jgi:hypothetical protein